MTQPAATLAGASVAPEVRFITDKLRASGKRGWLVGGCVRDMLMGRPHSDWDLATDALPDEVMRIFPRTHPTGIDHGTVTVMVGKTPIEVTTLRGEGAYTDGRRPDSVHYVQDLNEDLARRDFTVNAIALDPTNFTLIDPFDGQRDLAAKRLRAVGHARERFEEDGLRVLRAARFVATLELELDPETFAAIEPTLGTFRKVSPERVRDEWVKTMKARRPSRAFDVMLRGGILGVTCPELLLGVGMEQNRYHGYDVFRHAMECMDACRGDAVLRIAALLHDVGKPATRAMSDKTHDYTFYDHDRVGAELADPICQRLRFSNDERARIVALVRHHLFHYQDWSDAAVRRWIMRVGKDRVEDLYLLNEADLSAKGLETPPDTGPLEALKAHVADVLARGAALSTRDLAVNGHDLMALLGRKPGPWLKPMLEGLLEAVTNDPALNERQALLARAKEMGAGAGNQRLEVHARKPRCHGGGRRHLASRSSAAPSRCASAQDIGWTTIVGSPLPIGISSPPFACAGRSSCSPSRRPSTRRVAPPTTRSSPGHAPRAARRRRSVRASPPTRRRTSSGATDSVEPCDRARRRCHARRTADEVTAGLSHDHVNADRTYAFGPPRSYVGSMPVDRPTS